MKLDVEGTIRKLLKVALRSKNEDEAATAMQSAAALQRRYGVKIDERDLDCDCRVEVANATNDFWRAQLLVGLARAHRCLFVRNKETLAPSLMGSRLDVERAIGEYRRISVEMILSAVRAFSSAPGFVPPPVEDFASEYLRGREFAEDLLGVSSPRELLRRREYDAAARAGDTAQRQREYEKVLAEGDRARRRLWFSVYMSTAAAVLQQNMVSGGKPRAQLAEAPGAEPVERGSNILDEIRGVSAAAARSGVDAQTVSRHADRAARATAARIEVARREPLLLMEASTFPPPPPPSPPSRFSSLDLDDCAPRRAEKVEERLSRSWLRRQAKPTNYD